MNYEKLFDDYFKKTDERAEYRGVPIRPSGRKWNEGNCPGNPPSNDPSCKSWYCNTTIREWQCARK